MVRCSTMLSAIIDYAHYTSIANQDHNRHTSPQLLRTDTLRAMSNLFSLATEATADGEASMNVMEEYITDTLIRCYRHVFRDDDIGAYKGLNQNSKVLTDVAVLISCISIRQLSSLSRSI